MFPSSMHIPGELTSGLPAGQRAPCFFIRGLILKARRTLLDFAETIPTTCPGVNSRRSAEGNEEGRPVGRPFARGVLRILIPELHPNPTC